MPDKMRIEIAPNALVYTAGNPDLAGVTVILGHGAGADQSSDFMTRFATGLAARGVNVVTFNFLYTDHGRRAPDANKALEACFRGVIEAVRHKMIGRGTLVIGGKSMGGRIASQVAAASAPDVEGRICREARLRPGHRSLQVQLSGARAESSSFRNTRRAGFITICGSRDGVLKVGRSPKAGACCCFSLFPVFLLTRLNETRSELDAAG